MATEHEVRAELDALGSSIRRTLLKNCPVTVRYCPGNGTAYDLLFSPTWATAGVGVGGMSDRLMHSLDAVPDEDYSREELTEHKRTILLASNHGLYPWTWDHAPHVDYVAEKWMNRRSADGAALVLLLAAISMTEPHCTLADADIHVRDGASA